MGSLPSHRPQRVYLRQDSTLSYDDTVDFLQERTPPGMTTSTSHDSPASPTSIGAARSTTSPFLRSSTSSLGSATKTTSLQASMTCGSSGESECSKETGGYSTTSIAIALGIVIPITIFVVAMLVIWRVKKRRQRFEEQNDKHASLDFGLGEVSRRKKVGKVKGLRDREAPEMADIRGEKEFRNTKGMSMDMGSPYVLPAELTSSRPSFHSLSRSAHDGDDPYRPVNLIRGESPTAAHSLYSSRPGSRKDSASVWTQSSEGATGPKGSLIRNAERPAGTSPPALSTGQTPLLAAYSPSMTAASPISLSTPTSPAISSPLGLESSSNETDAQIVQPTRHPFRKPYVGNVVPSAATIPGPDLSRENDSQTALDALPGWHDGPRSQEQGFDFGLPSLIEMPSPTIHITSDDTGITYGLPSKRSSFRSAQSHINQDELSPTFEEYETYADVLGIAQKEPDSLHYGDNDAHQGLGVQGLGLNSHRLSASIRPLPPDDPEENPEDRANRIRSFYREYFDDRRDTRVGGTGAINGGYGGTAYYEDYSQEYLNGATLVDAETGQFVVGTHTPFTQPITRRAMTPPPRAPPRFRGGSGGGHGSGQFTPGKRNRGYSTASAQGYRGPAQKRPVVPPAPLNNLPTPHLLRDDSAIFNAMDFAPPSTYKDRQAGRPQSPRMEQRAYSPSVRAFTPLASSFNELRVMPSPYSLRKSGTFTALDFAPPMRFHGDGASDAGSIRSGRSNMSSQLASIRSGAYRVSRIPKGVVGTKDDFAASLRPTWDLRGPTP